MTRLSSVFFFMSTTLLVVAPWVYLEIRLPVYAIGVACLAAAVISRLLND